MITRRKFLGSTAAGLAGAVAAAKWLAAEEAAGTAPKIRVADAKRNADYVRKLFGLTA